MPVKNIDFRAPITETVEMNMFLGDQSQELHENAFLLRDPIIPASIIDQNHNHESLLLQPSAGYLNSGFTTTCLNTRQNTISNFQLHQSFNTVAQDPNNSMTKNGAAGRDREGQRSKLVLNGCQLHADNGENMEEAESAFGGNLGQIFNTYQTNKTGL